MKNYLLETLMVILFISVPIGTLGTIAYKGRHEKPISYKVSFFIGPDKINITCKWLSSGVCGIELKDCDNDLEYSCLHNVQGYEVDR